MRYVSANPSTQQTNTALLAAQSDRAVRIKEVYITSDTELTVSIVNSSGHEVLFRQYVGARGGLVIKLSDLWSAWGEGLDYTTSAAGNVYLLVGYEFTGG